MNAEQFYASYRDRGFYFPRSILTRYTLSLYSKPFVILSGVSGTGKTKIAQLFDPSSLNPSEDEQVAKPLIDRDRIVFTATSGMRVGDGRGNLANKHMEVVFEQQELETIRTRSAELALAGRDDNVIEPVHITAEAPDGQKLTFGLYVQRPRSPLVRLRAKSKRGETIEFDSQAYLKAHYKDNEPVEMEKLGPYRFRIVEKTTKGFEELKSITSADQQTSVGGGKNLLFIPVQSSWTDRTELFGFFNPLEDVYSCTPLIKFIQQAADNPSVPHFLILDEMNLSKVEYYFSDFLSCLESRIDSPNGITQEPIHLHNRSDFVVADDPEVELVPAKLFLPLNLYVTGTVNVDETTYMFSPKVLDRANVIEFNEVDLSLLDGSISTKVESLELQKVPLFGYTSPVTAEDYRAAPQSVQTFLKELVDLLQPYSMHFGYRVAQEICRFINAARENIADDAMTIDASLDAQIVQKILPKFSGSQAQLEEPLRKTLHKLLEGGAEAKSQTLQPEHITAAWLSSNTSIVKSSRYPLSSNKLIRMLDDLHVRGFTNSIG